MPENKSNIIKRQYNFIDQRPILARHNTDPLAIIELLKAEIDEFVEAYQTEQSMDEVAREAADIIIFAITLFKTLELDLKSEVNAKIDRNESKYPQDLFQVGLFTEAAAIAKKRWLNAGGDEFFYNQKAVKQKGQKD